GSTSRRQGYYSHSMPPRAKPAAKKPATPRKRKTKPAAGSVGLDVAEVTGSAPTAEATRLRGQIEAAGGTEIAAYREPLGGFWVALAALPLDKVKPTPY